MSDEKTEEPTSKKLDDAKKKGQSPKSQDVNAAVSVFGVMVCLMAAGEWMFDGIKKVIALGFDHVSEIRGDEQMLAIAVDLATRSLLIVLPVIAASVLLGLIAAFAQVGVNISFEPISPNFDKLNPAEGLKKLVSVKSLIEFAKMLLKAIALGWVAWVVIRDLVPLLVGAAYLPPLGIASIAWKAVLKLLGAASIVFIVVGPVDFALQKWLFIRDQRMTKDEIKREYKEMEGDPLIKGQRKQLAHELANSDPKQRVPNASVVVTNPTHYAVALYYESGRTPLPLIVAKGFDVEAMQIREIAEAHRIPIVGNPPLARSLYKLELDDPVPEELFEAVAAVLRWVAVLKTIGGAAEKP
jgi:type III secretion protein U